MSSSVLWYNAATASGKVKAACNLFNDRNVLIRLENMLQEGEGGTASTFGMA